MSTPGSNPPTERQIAFELGRQMGSGERIVCTTADYLACRDHPSDYHDGMRLGEDGPVGRPGAEPAVVPPYRGTDPSEAETERTPDWLTLSETRHILRDSRGINIGAVHSGTAAATGRYYMRNDGVDRGFATSLLEAMESVELCALSVGHRLTEPYPDDSF